MSEKLQPYDAQNPEKNPKAAKSLERQLRSLMKEEMGRLSKEKRVELQADVEKLVSLRENNPEIDYISYTNNLYSVRLRIDEQYSHVWLDRNDLTIKENDGLRHPILNVPHQLNGLDISAAIKEIQEIQAADWTYGRSNLTSDFTVVSRSIGDRTYLYPGPETKYGIIELQDNIPTLGMWWPKGTVIEEYSTDGEAPYLIVKTGTEKNPFINMIGEESKRLKLEFVDAETYPDEVWADYFFERPPIYPGFRVTELSE